MRGLAAKGRALLFGLAGVKVDELEAVALLNRCAQLNDPLGCHLLAVCYEKGLGGIEKNEKVALELCMKAKSLGRVECDECIKRVRPTS